MTSDISKEFWATISYEDFVQIVKRHGRLDAEQCMRLWRMENWPGEPPESVEILVRREDVMRAFPPLEKP